MPLNKYAQSYKEANNNKVGNKGNLSALDIIKRRFRLATNAKPIYDTCDDSGAKMIRNDLLARAFLFVRKEK